MLFAFPVEVLKAPRLDLLVFYSVICIPTGTRRHGTEPCPEPAGGYRGYRNSQNSQYSIYRNKHTEKPTTRRPPNTHLCARRHGADLSCQRQGSAPGPWKASCKGRFIFDRFAFEFLRFFAKGVVEKKEIQCKSLRKECFYLDFLRICTKMNQNAARRRQK